MEAEGRHVGLRWGSYYCRIDRAGIIDAVIGALSGEDGDGDGDDDEGDEKSSLRTWQ